MSKIKLDSHSLEIELKDQYDLVIEKLNNGDIELDNAVLEIFIILKVFFEAVGAKEGKLPFFDLEKILDQIKPSKKEKTSEKNFNLGCFVFMLVRYGSTARQAYITVSKWINSDDFKCSEEKVKKAYEFFLKEGYVEEEDDNICLLNLYRYKVERIIGMANEPFPKMVRGKKAKEAFEMLMRDLEEIRKVES